MPAFDGLWIVAAHMISFCRSRLTLGFRFLVLTFDMFTTNIKRSSDWHSTLSNLWHCLFRAYSKIDITHGYLFHCDVTVISKITQLQCLFFDLLVFYPINIHQPQQNLSCEKDNNKIKKKCSWTKHLHLEMKNKSCVHFDNNIQIKAVCNFVAAGTKKRNLNGLMALSSVEY